MGGETKVLQVSICVFTFLLVKQIMLLLTQLTICVLIGIVDSSVSIAAWPARKTTICKPASYAGRRKQLAAKETALAKTKLIEEELQEVVGSSLLATTSAGSCGRSSRRFVSLLACLSIQVIERKK